MKKLLFGLLLILTSSLSAQSYLRAKNFTLGTRLNESSPISWGESNDCSILIELYTTKVIINSKTLQTYHIINQSFASENVNTWLCKDIKGTTCKFTMMISPEYPGLLVCQVEYNDALWFYICIKD